MRLIPLGEELIIVEDVGELPPALLADWLESQNLSGIVEAAPAWNTVGVHILPEGFSLAELNAVLESLALDETQGRAGRTLKIPVCWDLGEDLEAAAASCSLSAKDLIDRLEAEDWPCRFIGFQPGFPYCGPLPPPLDQIPRLASPRSRVPAGSVAVAAGQLGIYPSESPGGWMLLGRTPLVICSPHEGCFPLKPGDNVRLHSITPAEFEARLGERP